MLLSIQSMSLFLQGVQCNSQTDNFYQILEVSPQASKSEIKKAFRRLSKKYHPDKNPGDEDAGEKFKLLNRAYEVLADDEKRQIYNHGGMDDLERHEQGQPARQKGPNARADITVSLEDLYLGTRRTLQINRNIYCDKCRGTGAKDGKFKTCNKCQGRGVVMQNVQVGFGMQMQMQTHCDRCGGKGKSMAAKCGTCKGRRLVNDNSEITIEIDKGMANGDHIIKEREGEQVPDLARGDLIFNLKQKPHKTFKRVGDNLYYDMHISLEESLLGFQKTIMHLDGHKVTVKSEENEVIQPDQWKILKGEGMPKKKEPWELGDLHVKMKITLPKKLSKKQQELIEEILQD